MNFSKVCDDLLPALENKTTSEIVAKNINAVHQARRDYIKSGYSSKMKLALKHQVRTYSDIICITGDLVYCKQKDNLNWKLNWTRWTASAGKTGFEIHKGSSM